SNWTPDFLQEFQLRRGYDLKKYLPQLLGRDSSDIGRRVLVDYRQTISDLLLDNFTQPWQHWATAKNKLIRNQSHGSPANILDLYAVVDIPETEGADILRFKFATSTAHVLGKPLASSETATWLNEHFQSSLGDVKQAVDKYFVGGVNHVFWHGTNYSPQNEPWPGWLFYAAVHFTPANPFWKDFGTLNNYVARCQSFLQKGKPDNDVLLYFPFNDKIAEMGRDMLQHFDGMAGFERTFFKSSAEWLLKEGYAFDLISDKQLSNTKNNGTLLQTSGGGNYKTIVLSDVKYIPLEVLQKLKRLAEQGAHIIFYKNLPIDVPGMADLAKRKNKLIQLVDGLQFSMLTNSSLKKAVIGKGFFLVGDDLEELLNEAKIYRETMVDKGLQYTRRSLDKGHCYFISNPGKTTVNEWIPLRVKEKNALLFDPMRIFSGTARTRVINGSLEVLLQLEAGASCILQTTQAQLKSAWYPYHTTTGSAEVLQGKWKINFLQGGPTLPADKELAVLGSWTDLPGDDVKNFSGTAQYRIHFTKPSVKADQYLLDLGSVQETAEVILNGEKIVTLLGPSYKLNIPNFLLKADNLLEIKVTNGMANRIADLERSGVVWKKFYNTNFPARLPQNRGSDGIFTAIKWEPKVSGLLGPVTIQPLQ
ncbi:MAG: glycosyl hydrolase, partial [Sediminibacterium sp.]